MAITKSTDLTNLAVTRYEKAFLDFGLEHPEIHGQFVDWMPPISDDGGNGASIDLPMLASLDPVETALTEDADVTPKALTDYNMTITPYEYGNTVARTAVAGFKSRVPLAAEFGRKVSRNRVESVDRIIRRAIVGRGSSYPTMTQHVDASVAMSSLATTDLITYAWLTQLRMQASYMGIEPIDGAGNYGTVIHPLLEYDLVQTNEFKYPGYYKTGDDSLLKGEIGMMGGIRFIVSPAARVYLGAGTAAQGATTLSAAANKGATTIGVAEATGLAVGNYITVGTLETESVNPGDNLEQALVTATTGSSGAQTLTIRCNGDANNFGLRFDHAISESVVEAANVLAVPILGQGSLKGVFASRTGRYGTAVAAENLDTLKRFVYLGWYWFGGAARVEKSIILGRCGTAQCMMGYN